ncbi:hypothetical protein Leryth_005590 [Lithospermum erythrorhizon]|nr:hypothetical protein Leryth_005590 [Lithospermum erythrorhizon]
MRSENGTYDLSMKKVKASWVLRQQNLKTQKTYPLAGCCTSELDATNGLVGIIIAMRCPKLLGHQAWGNFQDSLTTD